MRLTVLPQIVATPFSTGFDHLRLADEAQFRFNIAMRALRSEAGRLPIFGVGHSLGSLLHLLISARYGADRAGNVLLSFNNKPATDSIPFLSPFIAPGARALSPLLSQVRSHPYLRLSSVLSSRLCHAKAFLSFDTGPLTRHCSILFYFYNETATDGSPLPLPASCPSSSPPA